jgi:glyoxylase-like metal-dependent hydrolase (beta-lactamase superfamily II)
MELFVIEISHQLNGKDEAIYPVVLKGKNETLLVDCGFPGFAPKIETELQLQGLSLENFTGIIITHYDIDHVGGLAEIKTRYPHLKVYASALEEKSINGTEKPYRLLQVLKICDSLPDIQKARMQHFIGVFEKISPVHVDYAFSKDEEPSFLEDIQIIDTPGHLPGHISIYLKQSKILIAADALTVEDGEFAILNPNSAYDLQKAVESIKKINRLDIDKIICYHGGVISAHIREKLADLLLKYDSI